MIPTTSGIIAGFRNSRAPHAGQKPRLTICPLSPFCHATLGLNGELLLGRFRAAIPRFAELSRRDPSALCRHGGDRMPGEFMSKSPYFAEELIIRPGRRLWRVVRYRWHASGFEAVEAMADTSKPVDMSVDGNVVGRIGEDEI